MPVQPGELGRGADLCLTQTNDFLVRLGQLQAGADPLGADHRLRSAADAAHGVRTALQQLRPLLDVVDHEWSVLASVRHADHPYWVTAALVANGLSPEPAASERLDQLETGLRDLEDLNGKLFATTASGFDAAAVAALSRWSEARAALASWEPEPPHANAHHELVGATAAIGDVCTALCAWDDVVRELAGWSFLLTVHLHEVAAHTPSLRVFTVDLAAEEPAAAAAADTGGGRAPDIILECRDGELVRFPDTPAERPAPNLLQMDPHYEGEEIKHPRIAGAATSRLTEDEVRARRVLPGASTGALYFGNSYAHVMAAPGEWGWVMPDDQGLYLFKEQEYWLLHEDGRREVRCKDRNSWREVLKDIDGGTLKWRATVFHHSSLGQRVVCAGMVQISESGKIERINGWSGHFKPGIDSVGAAVEILMASGFSMDTAEAEFHHNHGENGRPDRNASALAGALASAQESYVATETERRVRKGQNRDTAQRAVLKQAKTLYDTSRPITVPAFVIGHLHAVLSTQEWRDSLEGSMRKAVVTAMQKNALFAELTKTQPRVREHVSRNPAALEMVVKSVARTDRSKAELADTWEEVLAPDSARTELSLYEIMRVLPLSKKALEERISTVRKGTVDWGTDRSLIEMKKWFKDPSEELPPSLSEELVQAIRDFEREKLTDWRSVARATLDRYNEFLRNTHHAPVVEEEEPAPKLLTARSAPRPGQRPGNRAVLLDDSSDTSEESEEEEFENDDPASTESEYDDPASTESEYDDPASTESEYDYPVSTESEDEDPASSTESEDPVEGLEDESPEGPLRDGRGSRADAKRAFFSGFDDEHSAKRPLRSNSAPAREPHHKTRSTPEKD
ncbi:hypothetical protein [Streptomyces sp. NPDC059918]|uniref:hypothetical protein n=1 Tax=unclassified Streptomyces TaxID=2593676 RepID=UPI0036676C92